MAERLGEGCAPNGPIDRQIEPRIPASAGSGDLAVRTEAWEAMAGRLARVVRGARTCCIARQRRMRGDAYWTCADCQREQDKRSPVACPFNELLTAHENLKRVMGEGN